MANEDPYGFPQAAPPNDGLPKIRSIFDFTAESLEELAVWLEQRGLTTPISQVLGFSQLKLQVAAPVITAETTSSLTETDLATVGPQITGLPDGAYGVFFGAVVSNNTAGKTSVISVSINSAAHGVDDLTFSGATAGSGVSRVIAVTLAGGGNNSLKMKYEVDGGTGTFARRWMYALRISA